MSSQYAATGGGEVRGQTAAAITVAQVVVRVDSNEFRGDYPGY